MEYKKIIAPLAPYINELNDKIAKDLSSELPFLQQLIDYSTKSSGKKIRPILLLISYRLFKPIDNQAIIAASIIEHIHNATLLHDDVIDNSESRRHQKTINANWGNRVAVLTGDFVLTAAIRNLNQLDNSQVLKIVSECTAKIAEGELLQLTGLFSNIDLEKYYQIIEWKTAYLIASAMKIGGTMASCSSDTINLLFNIGKLLGTAFQITDDRLDYDMNGNSGKTIGNDLRDHKITLPLTHLLSIASDKNKIETKNIINKKIIDQDDFMVIYEYMKRYKSLEYCYEKSQLYVNQSYELINKFPPSESREILLELANFIVNRND